MTYVILSGGKGGSVMYDSAEKEIDSLARCSSPPPGSAQNSEMNPLLAVSSAYLGQADGRPGESYFILPALPRAKEKKKKGSATGYLQKATHVSESPAVTHHGLLKM